MKLKIQPLCVFYFLSIAVFSSIWTCVGACLGRLIHELAHLLVYRRFGRVAPHGREWQWMMTEVLGVPAVRTHRFFVTSVRARTFTYRCQCKTAHELTVRRHNKVLRGESQYLCRHCKSTLVWDNSAAAISSPCDLTPDQS